MKMTPKQTKRPKRRRTARQSIPWRYLFAVCNRYGAVAALMELERIGKGKS